ncbi:hypothetical protein DVH05_026884 [Phytophthora capsici]|nr:hypothetical protein DVH05_026884 [Phytophthora capsici]
MACKVYEGGRQYLTNADLITEIKKQWDNLSDSYLEEMVLSMKKRYIKVLKADGKTIKYWLKWYT